MSGLPPSDPEALFQMAFTGKGTPLLSAEQFAELVDLAARRAALVHTVETFRVEGIREIPVVELSLYGPSSATENASWETKVSTSAREAMDMLADATRSGGQFGFVVWLDKE
jgi:hypothetical protein